MEIKIRNDKKRDKSVAYLTDRFAGEATLKASDNKKNCKASSPPAGNISSPFTNRALL